jgi:hypothetical protein
VIPKKDPGGGIFPLIPLKNAPDRILIFVLKKLTEVPHVVFVVVQLLQRK